MGQKSIICMVITIFVNRAYHQNARGYNIPIWTTPNRNFCFRARGHFLRLTPVFGRFGLVSLHKYKYPKFWTVFNETLWKRPSQQKMTQNDNGPGLGRNYGETAVFTFGRKVVFWPKKRFIPKKYPRDLYLFLKRVLFSLNNFLRLWPEHGVH